MAYMANKAAQTEYALSAIKGGVNYRKSLEANGVESEEAKRRARKWALRELGTSDAEKEDVLEGYRRTIELAEHLIETIEMSGMPKEDRADLNDGYTNP